jgi:hypothetical protein
LSKKYTEEEKWDILCNHCICQLHCSQNPWKKCLSDKTKREGLTEDEVIEKILKEESD